VVCDSELLPFLAAVPSADPLKTRTRNFSQEVLGQSAWYRSRSGGTATGSVQSAYKLASGRGEFLQTDPIGFAGGDVNLYRHVVNNPINNIDPLGLITIAIPGVGPQRDHGGGHSNEDFLRGVAKKHGDTQPFSRDELDEAVEAVKKAKEKDPCEEVNIYGYSRGGKAAVDLAQKLKEAGINVDNLVTIDPVTRGDKIIPVPSNVSNAQNHYQTGQKMGLTDFPGTPVSGAQNNLISDGEKNGYPVRHENMPVIILGK